MKLTNIKNVMIWALAMINVLFLAFYLLGIYSDSVNKTSSLRELAALFEKNGITLDPRNLGEGGVMPEYTTIIKEDNERKLAEALLGSTSKVDEGGNIYDFVGEKGRAKITGGEFVVTLDPGVYPDRGDAVKASRDILKLLQIETVSVTSGGSAGNETVVAVCAINHQPIFNCCVTLTFKKGSLAELSGKLAADIQKTTEETDMSSPATALMIFLRGVKNDGIKCVWIVSAEPGYILTETSTPGEGSLQPVWRIDTGSEVFTVNTVTRKISQSIE